MITSNGKTPTAGDPHVGNDIHVAYQIQCCIYHIATPVKRLCAVFRHQNVREKSLERVHICSHSFLSFSISCPQTASIMFFIDLEMGGWIVYKVQYDTTEEGLALKWCSCPQKAADSQICSCQEKRPASALKYIYKKKATGSQICSNSLRFALGYCQVFSVQALYISSPVSSFHLSKSSSTHTSKFPPLPLSLRRIADPLAQDATRLMPASRSLLPFATAVTFAIARCLPRFLDPRSPPSLPGVLSSVGLGTLTTRCGLSSQLTQPTPEVRISHRILRSYPGWLPDWPNLPRMDPTSIPLRPPRH